MLCVVYSHQGWQVQFISAGSYPCQDFALSDFLVVELFAWSGGPNISW